jgi:hypothetical protein
MLGLRRYRRQAHRAAQPYIRPYELRVSPLRLRTFPGVVGGWRGGRGGAHMPTRQPSASISSGVSAGSSGPGDGRTHSRQGSQARRCRLGARQKGFR